MVSRVYVEKRPGLDNEASSLTSEVRDLLGVRGLKKIRLFNRYDVENITDSLFDVAVKSVFSEPQLDVVSYELPKTDGVIFAVEYLPGQFDQRADSASQCIQIISCGERPAVRSAKVYVLEGELSDGDISEIKKYVINPVEAREASLGLPDTIEVASARPADVEVLTGFTSLKDGELANFCKKFSLAMDEGDAAMCRDYFASERRDPTIIEIRMIDTYWSDHCRHTTFLTSLDSVSFEDEEIEAAYKRYLAVKNELGRGERPATLMDIATVAAKYLRQKGLLDGLDVSDEINACTVKINVEVDGKTEPWLLLFKNETHNHPTEIEPFGGAATCIGGAIRDPLSGRSYVYAAMRVTGAADPTRPVSETIPGKLPQRKIVRTAAAGYSSYGNQIGLATGIVDELYHPGYAAKRMEIGAVIAATPAENVRRETPAPGDVVILLGGATGRDGIGGATGSSKAHDSHSVETCGAEVQKGNAPEERKLQRFFRDPDVCRMIKRCNDFGAGGVSVAIGELADGLSIDLDRVPKKYEGLDGTELAISESQERMAIVISAGDEAKLAEAARRENLSATKVATVTDTPRLVMRWRGKVIVDVSREFLNSNGAKKHIDVKIAAPRDIKRKTPEDFVSGFSALLSDLNVCSKRGLSERFDSTIGSGSVVMPFGGKYQRTPIQAMVHKIPLVSGDTDDCSLMAWGFNPFISEASPYHGAYLAVVESVSKLIASGASFDDVYLTFQEYFEKPMRDGARWGKPAAALLGALSAQLDLGIAAIGGKDSMSGSFESLDVPPTLVSFAVTMGKCSKTVTDEFKGPGHRVVLIAPEYTPSGLPKKDSLIGCFNKVAALCRDGKVLAAYTPTYGGVAEAIYKMCAGNGTGFRFDLSFPLSDVFSYSYGSFLLEVCDDVGGRIVGVTTGDGTISYGDESIALSALDEKYEAPLEEVFPTLEGRAAKKIEAFSYEAKDRTAPAVKHARPKVLIPVFPGTNCEYDSARAVTEAGAEAKIFVVKNLTPDDVARSAEEFAKELSTSQMLFVPGGFSGGDEPDGSGKFIMAFLKNEAIKEQVHMLLDERDGLVCGICNGFQALIKLGLVPYGKIIDTDEGCPTLTYNTIARHVSKLVRVRVASNKSPWLAKCSVGNIFTVPVSHGEGRFIASDELVRALAANGQIATQYVDLDGSPTDDVRFNPNGSLFAIEGITSPDGRVFGKMGHAERIGKNLYKNVPGEYDMKMFASAVEYFK
ncbi:MAG: phosphoribosylformylglycinamidine synthase [Clostridia bacterium]|nr:phosphoribosylformylglycinamidine synthase [Clostridia bacterium]